MGARNLEIKSTGGSHEQAVQELMVFQRDIALLIKAHLSDVREIMLTTVDQLMASVNLIGDAADHKRKKADELLVKDGGNGAAFVSRSAKEVDARYSDPAEQVKSINSKLSSHMATLNNLDESVRNVLFSIMGALSMDDVVRQRLEHVSTSIEAMKESIDTVVTHFSAGDLAEAKVDAEMSRLVNVMYKSFTMEEEKAVFRSVLGDVKNYR